MLCRTARLILVLLLVLPVRHAFAATDRLTLTILHTNDLHGHVLPFPYQERGFDASERPSAGGLARRGTLIAQLRRAAGHPVVVVDAGDVVTRGPLWTTCLGAPEIAAMNAMRYDLSAVGNNEFKLLGGVDAQKALANVVRRSRFPWICANVTDAKGAWLSGVKPYVVRDIGGVRIGFLSVTSARSREYPQTKGLRFVSPVTALRTWVPKVRARCDVLIAVTHVGVIEDRALAASVPGIDAIVGGDSHTFLHKAIVVRNPAGVEVPIVQAGEHGVYVGRLDLDLQRDGTGKWRTSVKSYALLPVGPPLKEDPAVVAAIEPSVKPFRAVVGEWPSIGGSLKDCERETLVLFSKALHRAAATDLALVTYDGFQGALRHSTVTRYDLYSAFAFPDHIVVASLTGAEIARLRDAHPDAALAGTPTVLDPARSYRVAMVDFVASDALKLPASRVKDTGIDVRDAVVAYLRTWRRESPKRGQVQGIRESRDSTRAGVR